MLINVQPALSTSFSLPVIFPSCFPLSHPLFFTPFLFVMTLPDPQLLVKTQMIILDDWMTQHNIHLIFYVSNECSTKTNHVFQVLEKFPDLKKNGKVPHAQDLVKEMSLPTNASNTWNRPRCGVPDYPTQKEVHYRGRHRQRRFVLYGGRLERTDLTYRYRSAELHTHVLVKKPG